MEGAIINLDDQHREDIGSVSTMPPVTEGTGGLSLQLPSLPVLVIHLHHCRRRMQIISVSLLGIQALFNYLIE